MLLSYAVIIVVCLSSSAAALFMMNKISKNLTSFYENNYTVTVNAWIARREMQYARADILRSILETDEKEKKTAIENASAALSSMRAAIPIIRERFKGDTTLVDQLEAILRQAVVYRDQIFELTEAGRKDQAFQVMKDDYNPLLNQMTDVLTQISLQAGRNAKLMVENGEQLQTRYMLITIVVIGISIIFAVFLGVRISNGIRRPVEEIKSGAEKLAAGSLAVSIDYQSEDELGILSSSMRSLIDTFRGMIGDISYCLEGLGNGDFTVDSKARELYVGDFQQLAVSIDQIIEKLRAAMEQINLASEQVSSGSAQVSSHAQMLAQGATEQAGAIEELAAEMNEISIQVMENARNAKQGSELAEAAGDKVEEGNRRVIEMMTVMKEISDKSDQVSTIVKTIEDIAFQTHILALNAAVEAARAGEMGKGFKVIAEEVRNLAAKSAEASKSTAVLIEQSVQTVEKGNSLADETGKTLGEAVEYAKQVVGVAGYISQASNEQKSSIAQISQAIDQISNVVQANSAAAEENAAAGEELSEQAQILKNLVAKFKLRKPRETKR